MPDSIGNRFVVLLANSPFYPLLGKNMAVVKVQGSKTGKCFSVPINVLPVGGKLVVISMRKRKWWRNLRGDSPAILLHQGKTNPVRGIVIELPSEVEVGLKELLREFPQYLKYLGVHLTPQGVPNAKDTERLAKERILIYLI
jgi:hypothetical protein